MARKKKTTRKKTGGFGGFFSKKKKRRKSKDRPSFMTGLKIALTILFLTILAGGGAVGLIYMDHYVKTAAKNETPEGIVVFKKPPIWLNQEWKDWIEDILGGATFPLDAHSAQTISQKLGTVAWFKNVAVHTEPNRIDVYAEYRRPVGLVGSRNYKAYVADDMTIMNYIPITAVPVVEIKGTSSKAPEPGMTWIAEDAKAAVKLLDLLYMMDLHFRQEQEKRKDKETVSPGDKIPEKPLLNEIESIDVANFNGRKSKSTDKAHIILNVKDGTKVYWGAAWGQAIDHVEAEEREKLAGLYEYFMEHNDTLQGTAKNIELRWPGDSIPRPR